MELSDKIKNLAGQFVYARDAKEAARLRIQCTLEEWKQVLEHSKILHARKVDRQRAR
jgi:hypothetical protein